jgi:hypothetical protein
VRVLLTELSLVLGARPQWEPGLSCQVAELQQLHVERTALAIFRPRHRRSSCVRDWCAAKEVLAEWMQLVVVEELVKELVKGSLLVDKVALDVLIQTMDEEVVTVSSHCYPT